LIKLNHDSRCWIFKLKPNKFKIIKLVSRIHSFVYLLSNKHLGGKLANVEILFLTTTGRNSGKPRTVPLASIPYNGNYFVVSSFGGNSTEPNWLRNIRECSRVYIQNKSVSQGATATIISPSDTEYSKMWNRATEIHYGFNNYKNATSRSIALVMFNRN